MQWIFDIAKQRPDMEVELIDLRDHPLPFFDEVATNAWVPTQNPEGVRWQKTIAQYDGYLFVSAEYNHGVPAVLKNALDYAYPEWNRKPAAFFGTAGSVAAGDRAASADLRQNCDGGDADRRPSGGR